jgi:hypothetical protein
MMGAAKTAFLVCLVFVFGCGSQRDEVVPGSLPTTAPVIAEHRPGEVPATETPATIAPNASEDVDHEDSLDVQWVLDRLRNSCASLPPDSTTKWAIAQSGATWSTCTVSFDVPFPQDGAATVWAKWTQPVSALTIKANRQIKAAIDAAVSDAIQNQDRAEREFRFKGFALFVNASAVPQEGMSFVRLSFKAE